MSYVYLEVEQTDDGHVCMYILLSCALYIMGTVVWIDQEILFKYQIPLLKYSPLVFIATGCEQSSGETAIQPQKFSCCICTSPDMWLCQAIYMGSRLIPDWLGRFMLRLFVKTSPEWICSLVLSTTCGLTIPTVRKGNHRLSKRLRNRFIQAKQCYK